MPYPLLSKSAVALLLTLAAACAQAADWHVSAADGNDAHDGKTPATALATLQKADTLVQPGDTVWVANGRYTNADKGDGGAVLTIRSSGRPDAWITWRAKHGHHPVVNGQGWAGIQIRGSYHVIDGLHVIGNNDAIALIRAQEDAKKPKPDPYYNTNGIIVDGRPLPPDAKPHHIVIRRCVVAKNAGGGITVIEGDHVTIEDNLVFDNAWFMRYGGSGITFLNNWQHDDAPGYHVVIQRNKVWNNKTLVPWERINKLSDGNGILLDVTDNNSTGNGATNPNADAVVQPAGAASNVNAEANNPKRPRWTARALIANNLSAYNGGSGIHTFRTAHVDIVNNTTYWNGGVVDYEELFANRSDDVVVLNNIIVPRPGGRVTSNHRNTRLRWDYNLYPVAQNVVAGPNDIVADPQFVKVLPDLRLADFGLKAGSPARDRGTDELAQATDLRGLCRPASGRDLGAYEALSPSRSKASSQRAAQRACSIAGQ